MRLAKVAIDGASSGNPGPAGIGVIISEDGKGVLKEISERIPDTTNNVAEYTALIRGLSEALEMGFRAVTVVTDSELLARQITGVYKVKNPKLAKLYGEALALMERFEGFSITAVSRAENREADRLASRAVRSESESSDIKAVRKKTATKRRGKAMVQCIRVRTSSRTQFVNITGEVQAAVEASGVSEGVCTVYVPHTTAGVTINENADPDVTRDIINTLDRLVPRNSSYRHIEGNADSHVKASLMGFSVNVPVENGRLVLGTWQAIYFCEFDGPRDRHVLVTVG